MKYETYTLTIRVHLASNDKDLPDADAVALTIDDQFDKIDFGQHCAVDSWSVEA